MKPRLLNSFRGYRYRYRYRYGYRRKKPEIRNIDKGIIHILASFNNTIITVTDVKGHVIYWSSAGACGFKGPKKGSAFAAQKATESVIYRVVIKRAAVLITGCGKGRDAALRVIQHNRIPIRAVVDITPNPHNGCRPPAKRRV
uniref:Small ribosomal subunit protein uS11c n=2 Tax=Welwitschia mirabilis TaxID=3377 RepID=RR11_WELMI|nr:ribosomal protein S11 [Welwitschia mirabilis]B2Y1Z2.1 RecName: Full=Small ribosomal subunit protein uS11c; AltName: Full=30S ribosomal protein S11, chloroplastic [Welwitschia mirabilis]ABY26822.1 ribosomal protein S11 [Welwitschia mirabilis]AMA21030.1 ribosomal protein S11 [Welwitschia mirabilis]